MLEDKKCPGLEDLGKGPIKQLLSVVGALGFVFPTHHNVRYGIWDVVHIVVVMCREKTSIEGAAKLMNRKGGKAPRGDWLLNLVKQLRPADIERILGGILEERLRGACRAAQAILAVDENVRARYDRNPNMRLLKKFGKLRGTSTGEVYMSAMLVNGLASFTTSLMRVTRGNFTSENAEILLADCKRKLGVDRVLMLADRGFCHVATILAFERLGLQYIMPVSRNSRIARIIEKFEAGRWPAVSNYTMRSADGSSCTFKLVLKRRYRRGRLKVIPFATNIDRDDRWLLANVSRIYSKRWKIETLYRYVRKVTPFTTSRNESIRMFLAYMAFIICNEWVAVRRVRKGLPVKLFLWDLTDDAKELVWARRPPDGART